MAHCVNRSSEEFKSLAEQSNINPIILAAKVSLWQEVNGLDNFPNINDIINEKQESTESSIASKETIALLNDFIKRIDVDIKPMKQIIVNGVKQDAQGAALLMQKIIQVVEGKEASTLPEEAMHFVVEIVKQTNPKLYNKLLKEINNYNITKQVMRDYSSDPNYIGKDGKPDIIKLKEEAIAKLLAETIINQNEGSTEKPELLEKVDREWWQEMIDWLKSLIIKSGFDQVSMNILTGKFVGTANDIRTSDNNVFLQKSATSKQDDIIKNMQDLSNRITKKENGVDENGDPKDSYFIDGKVIKSRVSDLVAGWYERKFPNDVLKNDFQKTIDELKAEKGTAGHAAMEYAFTRFVDGNGYLRDVPLDDVNYDNENPDFSYDMYEILRDNLKDRLESFDKGRTDGLKTRFLKEQMIYDAKRDLAGTVDLLAVTPEGKVSIFDWKFMDLDIDKYTDIPWYKADAWNLQMQNYKSIISSTYNVNSKDFEQTIMVPIKALYSKANYKENRLPELMGIKIGDVDVKNIHDDYLIPVALKDQKTGNDKVDELLEKLNAVYQKISNRNVLPGEKTEKAEQLNALFTAIRQLQMRQNIAPLLTQAKVLNKDVEILIETFKNKYEGKDAASFNNDDINEFAFQLEDRLEALDVYLNLDIELEFLFEGELSDEEKELEKDLNDVVKVAKKTKDKLSRVDKNFTDNIIAKSVNVDNLSTPEKIVRGINKLLGNTATIQLKGMQVLFKKANSANYFTSLDTQTEVKRLEKLKNAYDSWARSKGLSEKNYFDILKKKNSNELIDEFNPEFYNKLKEASAKDTRDLKWIKDNIDIKAYQEHLDKKLKEEIDRIRNREKIVSESQLNDLSEQGLLPLDVQNQIDKAKALYNISTITSAGWLLQNEIKKFPLRDKWESVEFKELNDKSNEVALDFYNYIKERNDYFLSIGYIHNSQARTFLPWVRKGLAEKLIFGGRMALGEQFLRNMSVDEADTGYGQIDPLTGKPVDTIPKYLISDIGEDYSTDLFKTMAMYNEFGIKFKYMSDIENQIRAVVRLEKNKKAIATSRFGRTKLENDAVVFNPDNSENAKLIEDMMKAIVYGQQYIESESFDQLLGTFGKFGEKINNKLGFQLLPQNLEGRQLSINKSITVLNNQFQVATLGFNVLSSISNLFGGKTQAFINSGVYGTKLDFIETEMWLLQNRMGGSDKQKMIAALDYFMPLTENFNKLAIKGLSINKITQNNVQDILMSLMRFSDHAVQMTGFFTFLKNSVVIDGEVVNARQYLRTTSEFSSMNEGTSNERNLKADKFEQAVKNLVEEKGVLKLGNVVDGEFIIPGIDRRSNSVIDLRRKVQQFTSDALGSMTEENKRLMNLSIYGNSFMLFKNWIPRLVDVRAGNLKYNSASDAYEWGRSRMVYRMISEDLLKSLSTLKGSIMGYSDNNIEFMRQLYEKKKNDYEKDTGKVLTMTEDDFIELVKANTRNQLLDTLFYASLFALYAGLKAIPPDDDEDPRVKNQYKFLLKATDKLKDELGYFYNPANLTQLFSNGIFPSVGLIDNYVKVVVNFGKEMYGLSYEDDKYVEKNHVIKYLMKTFPITNQMSAMLPMFYPNLAKDLGIKMPSQYGIR